MADDPTDADLGTTTSYPSTTGLPAYLLDALDARTPEELERVAAYATVLADRKRAERERETEQTRLDDAADDDVIEELRENVDEFDPDNPPNPSAYVNVKTPNKEHYYAYWQWREGDSWKNEYIGPVSGRRSP